MKIHSSKKLKLKRLLSERKSAEVDKILKATRGNLQQRGKFFYTTDREAYYFDVKGKNIYSILDNEFSLWLAIEFGLDRSDKISKKIISYLETIAFQSGAEIRFYKFSHFDVNNCTLYVNRFNGRMFKLDGETIKKVDMGTDGIFFNDEGHPIILDTPSPGLTDSLLFNRANFEKSILNADEQRFVLKWWFYSTFFRSILQTKPILVIYGPPNSWKTEIAKAIVQFLFGPEADVISPPDSTRDLRVVADHEHLIIIDDIEKRNRSLESELVRMATGVKAENRETWTFKKVGSLNPDAFIALTTKLPHFTREDLMQRVFILRLVHREKNISSTVLQQKVLDKRSQMWSEVLMELNKVIKRMNKRKGSKPVRINFRHAAWAEFVFKATHKKDHEAFKNIISKINEDQIGFLLESNALAKALSIWLEDRGNLNRWVTSGELRSELLKIAKQHQLDSSIYSNDQVYGAELKNVVSTFSRIYDVQSDRPRGRNEYYFGKKK